MAFRLLLKSKYVLFSYLPTVFQKITISRVEADTHATLHYKPAHLLFVVVIKRSLITQKGFCCSWQIYADYIQHCKSCINIPHICWSRRIFFWGGFCLTSVSLTTNRQTEAAIKAQRHHTIRSPIKVHAWLASFVALFPRNQAGPE